MTTSPSLFGAVIFAKDVQGLAQFYAQVADLSVQHAAEDHVVLGAPGVELVIHGIPARIAVTIEITTPPQRRSEMPIKLFFRVESLQTARAAARRLGGTIVADDDGWLIRGARVCDGVDPEGNVLQLRENSP